MIPVCNFNGKLMTEQEIELFNTETLIERVKAYGGKVGHACQPGCLVTCSNVVNDESGKPVTASLEFETVAMFGPNCKIYDLEVLIKLDRFCDDFGFDTIDAGASLGVYFDSGEMAWGDGDGALAMFESFWKEDSELARAFGEGTEYLGKKFGVMHISTVKSQSLSAYDPRNMKGTGTTYAISTMGADHTCGLSLGQAGLEHTDKTGQVDFAVGSQAALAACDSHVCLFAFGGIMAVGDDYVNAINAAYGFEWTVGDLFRIGGETIEAERDFNRKAGITPDQDVLPEFFYTEPSETGAIYDITAEEIAEKWHA